MRSVASAANITDMQEILSLLRKCMVKIVAQLGE